MLRDITIGQFYPAKSRIHALDPRVKVAITFLYLISLFLFKSFTGYLIVTLFLFSVIKMSHVPLYCERSEGGFVSPCIYSCI